MVYTVSARLGRITAIYARVHLIYMDSRNEVPFMHDRPSHTSLEAKRESGLRDYCVQQRTLKNIGRSDAKINAFVFTRTHARERPGTRLAP